MSDLRIFMIGGGASGFSSHSGAGGAGYIQNVNYGQISAGTSISITIGAGGQRTGNSGNSGPAYNGGATTVTIGGTTYTASGGTNSATGNMPGGNGSSGGGGAGNGGTGGKGGSGGSNGDSGNTYGGGTGMGVAAFDSAVNPTVVLSAGAGGAAGNSSHSGGGGAGGIITNIVAYPTAENGGSSVSGKGGVGFGAGGGSGGYDGTYYYGGAGAPGMVYIYSTAGSWNILLKTTGAKPAISSMGNFQNLIGNAAFKTMTVSTANGRKTFGSADGFYEGFFTTKKITKLALVDGTSTSLTNLTGNTNYIIYDLVETSGEETMFQILNRLDTYAGNNAMSATNAPAFTTPSVVNFTAGINGYSGIWSARSSAGAFGTSTFPDKICVCGINIDSDDDIQVFAAYWGNLASGKGDAWRILNPLETLWSLWGNDYHSNSTNQRISAGIQTSPGINASVSGYTGDVYLLAFSSGIITPTLTVSKNKYITKYILNGTINFDVFSTDADSGYTREFSSNNGAMITVPNLSSPNVTIVGPGRTTINVTQSATTNYAAVTIYNIIEFVIVGQNQTYTSDDMTSLDLSGTNLSGSVFTTCTLTGADLYNTTVNASTSFTTSTLNSLKSGRITGVTSLLPTGYIMI
jgi:hypothetical protein